MVGSIQGFGAMQQMGNMRGPQSLTADQNQTVQDILSEYDTEDLTAEDAKSIFKAFEEAGIRGPGLREAVKGAGFDADQVWSLAHDGETPPAPPSGGQRGGQINLNSLQSLQTILDQYDLTDMTDDQESALLSQLEDQGLLNTGGLIDLGV